MEPWTGIEPARPGAKVRIGHQQPPRHERSVRDLNPWSPARQAGVHSSWTDRACAESGRVERHARRHHPVSNQRPRPPRHHSLWQRAEESNPCHFRDPRFSRPLPDHSGFTLFGTPPRNRTLLSGLRVQSITTMLARHGAPSRTRTCTPRRDLGYNQAGQPIAQPTHGRGAGIPPVTRRVAAADRSPLPIGSGSCLMLFAVEFAPTP